MGVVNEQPRRAVKAPSCGAGFVLVGLLRVKGARVTLGRPDAPCYLAKEYPRRTGRNQPELRGPPGNYGVSCSMKLAHPPYWQRSTLGTLIEGSFLGGDAFMLLHLYFCHQIYFRGNT